MMTTTIEPVEFLSDSDGASTKDTPNCSQRHSNSSALTAEDLTIFWDLWINTVRRIENKKNVKISKRRYMATYARIMRLCEDGDIDRPNMSSSMRPLHISMRFLVSPWVSLESLQNADRKLLRNLLGQCGEIDRAMHPRALRLHKKWFPALVMILFIGCGAAAATEHQLVAQWGRFYLTMASSRLWLAVGKMSTEHWLGFLAVLMVILGTWMTRDMRKY
jgi:hypothetical protein